MAYVLVLCFRFYWFFVPFPHSPLAPKKYIAEWKSFLCWCARIFHHHHQQQSRRLWHKKIFNDFHFKERENFLVHEIIESRVNWPKTCFSFLFTFLLSFAVQSNFRSASQSIIFCSDSFLHFFYTTEWMISSSGKTFYPNFGVYYSSLLNALNFIQFSLCLVELLKFFMEYLKGEILWRSRHNKIVNKYFCM